jgi:hypothetical protein
MMRYEMFEFATVVLEPRLKASTSAFTTVLRGIFTNTWNEFAL